MFDVLTEENYLVKLTRGDYAPFEITAKNDDGSDYMFQVDDVVRIAIYKKGNMKDLKLSKDVTVTEESLSVSIELFSNETKIDDIISKPTDYWYEVTLNPDTDKARTILGYDDVTGAKIFRLLPEGGDGNANNN